MFCPNVSFFTFLLISLSFVIIYVLQDHIELGERTWHTRLTHSPLHPAVARVSLRRLDARPMTHPQHHPLTCFIVVVSSILNAPEDARQARLADAVLAEQDHLVHLGLSLAAGGDDRVRGVGRAAAPVLIVGRVGRAAQQVGQLVGLAGLGHRGAQVPVVHRHAPPVQVGQVHGERHAASPLVHVPQFVTLVQSHCACDARLRTDVTHA